MTDPGAGELGPVRMPFSVKVGETPLHLRRPIKLADGTIINEIKVGTGDAGPENARILVKAVGSRVEDHGQEVAKPLPVDPGSEIPDIHSPSLKVQELQFTETKSDGTTEIHHIPVSDIAAEPFPSAPEPITPPETTSAPEPTPPAAKPTSSPATTAESKKVISVIGIRQAIEAQARGLTQKKLQEVLNAKGSIVRKTLRSIWKGNLFREVIEEKTQQYYEHALKTAENPFLDESLTRAEEVGTQKYQEYLDHINPLRRFSRRIIEAIKAGTSGFTMEQEHALREIGRMKEAGEITEAAIRDRELSAYRERFEQEHDRMNTYVRKELGETYEILDPTKAEHKPLIDGIHALIIDCRDNNLSQEEFNKKFKEFREKTLKKSHPQFAQIYYESEMYATTLFETAQEMRVRSEHRAGLDALDAELEGMQIRLGIGSLGEVTQLERSTTRKAVAKLREWFQKKATPPEADAGKSEYWAQLGANLVANEAAIGSGVSYALALGVLPLTAVRSGARAILGVAGGGVVAGVSGYFKEVGRRRKEFLTVIREMEAGEKGSTGTRMRAWYEQFGLKPRQADEIITSIRSPLYEADGMTLKSTLTEGELRKGLANIADAIARRMASGQTRDVLGRQVQLGFIELGEKSQQETTRTLLQKTVDQAERDLAVYCTTHATDPNVQAVLGGKTSSEFISDVTLAQITAINQGREYAENLFTDPVKATLNEVSMYAPEADLVRRRFLRQNQTVKLAGADQILAEFKSEAKKEALKHGLVAGAVGAGVGALAQEIAVDVRHAFATGHWEGVGGLSAFWRAVTGGEQVSIPAHLAPAEMVTLPQDVAHGNLSISNNLLLDNQGNLDVVGPNGGVLHDNLIPDLGKHLQYDPDGSLSQSTVDYINSHTPPGFHLDAHSTFAAPVRPDIPAESIHTAVPSHDTTLPGVPTITDADGVSHSIRITVPQGTELNETSNGVYSLVDTEGADKGRILLSGIRINDHGDLLNQSELTQKAAQAGLKFGPDTTEHLTIPGETIPGREAVGSFDNKYVRDMGDEKGAHGPWGWLEDPIRDSSAGVEHDVPGTNLTKNLFRGYEENVIHSSNVVAGANGKIPWDIEEVKVSYNAMQGDLLFKEVPVLFKDENLVELGKLMDASITHVEQNGLDWRSLVHDFEAGKLDWDDLSKTQREDLIHALAYKIGRVGNVATDAEYKIFNEYFSVPSQAIPSQAIDLHHETILREIVETLPTAPAKELVTNTIQLTEIPLPSTDELNQWIPIVPIGRRSLERPTVPEDVTADGYEPLTPAPTPIPAPPPPPPVPPPTEDEVDARRTVPEPEIIVGTPTGPPITRLEDKELTSEATGKTGSKSRQSRPRHGSQPPGTPSAGTGMVTPRHTRTSRRIPTPPTSPLRPPPHRRGQAVADQVIDREIPVNQVSPAPDLETVDKRRETRPPVEDQVESRRRIRNDPEIQTRRERKRVKPTSPDEAEYILSSEIPLILNGDSEAFARLTNSKFTALGEFFRSLSPSEAQTLLRAVSGRKELQALYRAIGIHFLALPKDYETHLIALTRATEYLPELISLSEARLNRLRGMQLTHHLPPELTQRFSWLPPQPRDLPGNARGALILAEDKTLTLKTSPNQLPSGGHGLTKDSIAILAEHNLTETDIFGSAAKITWETYGGQFVISTEMQYKPDPTTDTTVHLRIDDYGHADSDTVAQLRQANQWDSRLDRVKICGRWIWKTVIWAQTDS